MSEIDRIVNSLHRIVVDRDILQLWESSSTLPGGETC
jgi:hypothetical protein